MIKRHLVLLLLPFFLLLGCGEQIQSSTEDVPTATTAVFAPTDPPAITTTPVQETTAATPNTPPSPTATIIQGSPTPFYTGDPSPPCGQQLPLLPSNTAPTTTEIPISPTLAERVRRAMPNTAVPAFDELLAHPERVGLVAYRMGDEANGIYLNADVQMPIASVSKLLHLVAYAEALAAGELEATQRVPLLVLEQYYLRGSDLGSHRRAVAWLAENGRVDANEAISLDDVATIMMRFSSNAATDYLHYRLGQQRLEKTAVALGLNQHTAPCSFLTQFLAMSNPIRTVADETAYQQYLANPTQYAAEAGFLADAYIAETNWRESFGRWQPSVSLQMAFVRDFGTHATPNQYAGLMARLAQNGLSNGESSYQARRLLEWPTTFTANRSQFSNVGYKDGNLPGVLTTVYYAYRLGEVDPIVVILFYHDLPFNTYQRWRDSLPHDELARWLLTDEQAIPLLRLAVR